MDYDAALRVQPGTARLADIDPGFEADHLSKKEAKLELDRKRKKVRDIQGLLYATPVPPSSCACRAWTPPARTGRSTSYSAP